MQNYGPRNSLHKLIQIDLAREEQRRQVGGLIYDLVPEDSENTTPINREFHDYSGDNHQTTQLKANQKTIEFFDREDIQGKLLILGEPGAGKTTELISLAHDLIARAVEDDTVPIPIIFELSSWNENLPISRIT